MGQRARHALEQMDLKVSRRAFVRVARDVLDAFPPLERGRWLLTPEGLLLLHWQSEEYLVQRYEEANAITTNRRAVTLHPRDTRALDGMSGRFLNSIPRARPVS